MNQRRAREIRKKLGMSKENLRKTEWGSINPVEKIVFFRDPVHGLVRQKVTRVTLVNKNKYFYRKTKKQILRGKANV